MANLEAKIGADSSQFRNDVGSLPGVVKSNFDKMKTASDGGLADNVKGLKKGFNDFKELLVGGGVVEGVKKFFDVAIDNARKSTDANDQNAAAVRRFGDALDSVKKTGADFATQTVGTFNRIGESIGLGAKMVAGFFTSSVAQVEQAEKVLQATDKAAREAEASLAEAKKHAAEFNQLTAEAKQLTEARADAERKALTLSQQRDVLEQKMLEAERASQDENATALERRKAQVEQIKIGNQLLEVQKGINDETSKQDAKRRSEIEAINKQYRDGLDTQSRLAAVSLEINDTEALIASGAQKAEDREASRVKLAALRVEYAAAENKASDEAQKYDEARAVLADKQGDFARELLTAQDRYNDAKKEEANLRAEINKMEDGTIEKTKEETRLLEFQKKTREAAKDVASADKEIAELLLKGKENLNEQEKIRLALLSGETTQVKLDKELHELTAGLIAGSLTPAEKERLSVLIGQTAEIAKQKDAMAETLRLVQARVTVEQTSHGDAYSSMSDDSLAGTLARLNSKLADAKNADTMAGFHVGGTYHSPDIAQYENDISKIERELAQRREISDYARRYGEAATVRQYGDSLAEKAIKDVRDTSTRTANSLESINDRLANSPLFPRGK